VNGEESPRLALFRAHALHGARHRGHIGDVETGAPEAEAGRAFDWKSDDAVKLAVGREAGELALVNRHAPNALVELCDADGFYALDFVSAACRKLADPDPGKPRIRMNDGKVDRQGRFVAGYMDYEERDPICGLFRLDPSGSVAKLDEGVVCSNGPCWSPDGRTFYFADTYTREIWAYDYNSRCCGTRDRASYPAPAAPSRA
jgi:sugar lactone lactonase YvrE